MNITTNFYTVTGDVHTYIGKFEKVISDCDNYTITLGGKDASCVVFGTRCEKGAQVTEMYLDRVEYNSKCAKNEDLIRKTGTMDMVHTALWFVKDLFPSLKKVTLMDDSHIECFVRGRKYKLPLAQDYIIKENKTWYQDKFNAELPKELAEMFQKSLNILDWRCDPIDQLVEKGAIFLTEFKDTYSVSLSPRDFIKRLQKELGDQYCSKVALWLAKYFMFLHIDVYKLHWQIMSANFKKPVQYKKEPYVLKTDGGSTTRRTRKRRTITHRLTSDGDDVYVNGSL
jgi:hypothetical protein